MSRFFAAAAAFGAAVAAPEIEAAVPYVKAALDELGPDLKDADPATALLATATSAYSKMKADSSVVPSLTGIMALVGGAAMDGYAAYLAAPADPAVLVAATKVATPAAPVVAAAPAPAAD